MFKNNITNYSHTCFNYLLHTNSKYRKLGTLDDIDMICD